jgi:hypothetical protein
MDEVRLCVSHAAVASAERGLEQMQEVERFLNLKIPAQLPFHTFCSQYPKGPPRGPG